MNRFNKLYWGGQQYAESSDHRRGIGTLWLSCFLQTIVGLVELESHGYATGLDHGQRLSG
jgi:hypothetical protein